MRLTPLPAPKIVASAEEYPGGSYRPAKSIDGATHTEYASNGKGTGTFMEFNFRHPVAIGGFRHVDRNDPATVGAPSCNSPTPPAIGWRPVPCARGAARA